MEIEGYCLKCKVKRKLSNARVVTLKNGRPAAKGNCPVCGRGVMTFLSAREAKVWQQLDKRDVEKSREEDVKRMESMWVVHSVPGRVRLRLDPESPQPNLDDFLIDGVKKVAFNKITKSVLMVYDDTIPSESLLSGIEEKMRPIVILREEPRTGEAINDENRVGQAIVRRAGEINERVSAATNGLVSGESLFPLSLIGLGVVGFLQQDDLLGPPWWSLVWWGFNIFRGWHRRDEARAKGVEEKQVAVEVVTPEEEAEVSEPDMERESAVA